MSNNNYEILAKGLIPLVGGKDNIKNLTHCMTRLIFILYDENKADINQINKLNGVKIAQYKGGNYK